MTGTFHEKLRLFDPPPPLVCWPFFLQNEYQSNRDKKTSFCTSRKRRKRPVPEVFSI